MMKKFLYFILATTLCIACEHDPYETGDLAWSRMLTELVDLHVQGNAVKSITKDDGKQIPLVKDMYVSQQLAHKDTTYRMLLSYVIEEDKSLTIYSTERALVLSPTEKQKSVTEKNDPVKIDNAWLSESGNYLNVRLTLMTGSNTSDPLLKHKIGLILDDVQDLGDGKKKYIISLRHDQNNLPTFYSATYYLCIPVGGVKAGSVLEFSANTFSGLFKKEYTKAE